MIKDIMEVFNEYGDFVYRHQEPRIIVKIATEWMDSDYTLLYKKTETTDLTNYSKKNVNRLLSITKKWKEIYTSNPQVSNWGNSHEDVYWLSEEDYNWFVGYLPWGDNEDEPDIITDISFTYSVGSTITDFKFREENSNE